MCIYKYECVSIYINIYIYMESTGGSEATTFKAPRRQRQKRAESDSARLGNCSVTDQGEFNRKLSWQGAKPRTPRRPMRGNERQTQHENQLPKPLHATELPKACWSRVCKCVLLKNHGVHFFEHRLLLLAP